MQNEIKQTWRFSQAPEEVWEYLTQPELMEQWFAKTDFQPVAGAQFRLDGKGGCVIQCEVLEVKPFTRLVYSWQTTSAKDNALFDSKVVWTLVPDGQGTELQLVHGSFAVVEDYTLHNSGWTKLLNRVGELLNAKENVRSNA